MLRGSDNQRAGVRGRHAGEDGGVDDEDVVGAVDAGVEVDDGGAAEETGVGAEFGGAEPVCEGVLRGVVWREGGMDVSARGRIKRNIRFARRAPMLA